MSDLERARSIAVALEAEVAELRKDIDAAVHLLRRGHSTAALALLTMPDDGDVVGQEGLPLGDPWADSPIPEDWQDES